LYPRTLTFFYQPGFYILPVFKFQTIGYVYTSYGQRPLADVKADIQKYLKWYNVNGFFFDETLADATREAYYTNLANYVRSIKPSYLVVLNPGVIPTVKTYFDFADLVSSSGKFYDLRYKLDTNKTFKI
jgi:hypothetical protein